MGTETITPIEEPTPVDSTLTETVETVGVSEQVFISCMDSVQNLLTVQIVGLAFLAGCILALICTEVFKRV